LRLRFLPCGSESTLPPPVRQTCLSPWGLPKWRRASASAKHHDDLVSHIPETRPSHFALTTCLRALQDFFLTDLFVVGGSLIIRNISLVLYNCRHSRNVFSCMPPTVFRACRRFTGEASRAWTGNRRILLGTVKRTVKRANIHTILIK